MRFLDVLCVRKIVVRALFTVVHQAVAHFIADPVQSKLRMNRGAFLVTAQAAYNQFVVIQVIQKQRRMFQHISNPVGAFYFLGLAAVGFVSLCHQFGAVRGNKAVCGSHCNVQYVVDTRKRGGKRRIAGQPNAPFFVKGFNRLGLDVNFAGVCIHILAAQIFCIRFLLCNLGTLLSVANTKAFQRPQKRVLYRRRESARLCCGWRMNLGINSSTGPIKGARLLRRQNFCSHGRRRYLPYWTSVTVISIPFPMMNMYYLSDFPWGQSRNARVTSSLSFPWRIQAYI